MPLCLSAVITIIRVDEPRAEGATLLARLKLSIYILPLTTVSMLSCAHAESATVGLICKGNGFELAFSINYEEETINSTLVNDGLKVVRWDDEKIVAETRPPKSMSYFLRGAKTTESTSFVFERVTGKLTIVGETDLTPQEIEMCKEDAQKDGQEGWWCESDELINVKAKCKKVELEF
jgi:hypothetical protein